MAHRVVASNYGEPEIPGSSPVQTVAIHATEKAREVAARSGVPVDGAVLGADTTVIVHDRSLGKPVDRDDARRMLEVLAGRTHVVATAVCVITGDAEHTFVDETAVTFRALPAAQVEWYLERGEWQGRAGAYAIQGSGAALVASVSGDFSTVVGLPLARLVDLLEELGMVPWHRPAVGPGS